MVITPLYVVWKNKDYVVWRNKNYVVWKNKNYVVWKNKKYNSKSGRLHDNRFWYGILNFGF